MNEIKHMRDIMRHIEANIGNHLETTELSNVGYISRDKLYKDFYSVGGHSVKEYVRKRRLSNALTLIKVSKLSLTEIALQCGYSSHQALCRAVKQSLGVTPIEYRDGGKYYFFPPNNIDPLFSVTVINERLPATDCNRYYNSNYIGIEDFAINSFYETNPNFIGRIFGRNDKQEGFNSCYELYTENNSVSTATDGLFATLKIKYDVDTINAAWNYLYYDWIHGSMFEYTGEPYFEEYIIKNGKPVNLKLYLPIRKRNDGLRISIIPNPCLRFIAAEANGYIAEKTAAELIIDYIKANYRHLIDNTTGLYIQKTGNRCVCGVKVDFGGAVRECQNVFDIKTKNKNYILLESNITGDYSRYAEQLLSFARKNKINADEGELFAVYDSSVDCYNMGIKMYCPINI